MIDLQQLLERQNTLEAQVAETRALLTEALAHEQTGDLVTQGGVIPLATLERLAILHAMRVTQGDYTRAAKLLGIGKTTLYRKCKDYERAQAPTA